MTATAAVAAVAPAWAAGAVPAGFRPGSASFVSPAIGFVLGAVNCKPGHVCRAKLVTTGDSGARWRVLASPATATSLDNVLFAGRRTGWIYGTGLWVTRNGGGSWSRLRLGGRVTAMAVSAGAAYAVVAKTAGVELFTSPVGRNAWHRVRNVRNVGPEPALAAFGLSAWFGSGSTVWATADGGSRWRAHAFACAKTGYSLAGISAASRSVVYFLCLNLNADTGHERMEVMVSADGGKTERLAGGKSPVIGDDGLIAVPPGNPSVITFAASAGIPSWIGRSANGGKTWRQVGPLYGNGPWNSLRYASKTAGWIVLGRPGLARSPELLRSTDAGRSWHQVRF